jgi:hypothetical protein
MVISQGVWAEGILIFTFFYQKCPAMYTNALRL